MDGKNKFEIKLKSEMYNHDNEKITRREIPENKFNTNKILIISIICFLLLIITFIIIYIFTR